MCITGLSHPPPLHAHTYEHVIPLSRQPSPIDGGILTLSTQICSFRPYRPFHSGPVSGHHGSHSSEGCRSKSPTIKRSGAGCALTIPRSLPPLPQPDNLTGHWVPPPRFGLTAPCCPCRRQPGQWAAPLSTSHAAGQPSPGGWWSGDSHHSEQPKVTSLAVSLPPGEVRREKPVALK